MVKTIDDGMSHDTGEGSEIDAAISTVDSYIEDPSLVTPDTLRKLRAQLVAAKNGMVAEPEDDASVDYEDDDDKEGPKGLAIIIGRAKRRMR